MSNEQLSEHFSLDEMTRSQTALRLGIDNTPSAAVIANMRILCATILEPARKLLNCPMHTDSGYRSPALNGAVGGSRTSAHMDGRAEDFIPIGMSLQEAFDKLRRSDLPYDQIIIECNAWIHIGIAPYGDPPRRQAMTASGTPGHWKYALVTA
jgi:zinc D-Ala-D-Ala carboxypeptidase